MIAEQALQTRNTSPKIRPKITEEKAAAGNISFAKGAAFRQLFLETKNAKQSHDSYSVSNIVAKYECRKTKEKL